ncbi:MAG: DUF1840 domain-containing protein [Zoogloeaceae bacterium]|nr:DUF1840 domain-containing protein [Zoogloeaceae bacterium]
MVITFQSRATSDVMMFGDVAERLLSIVGKDPKATRGILTVEQLPEAIARLNEAIEADRNRAREADRANPDREEDEDIPEGMAAPVSLHQRGWPLLEMMARSHAEGVPVTWGA